MCFNIEPTNVIEALKDQQWVKAMQEELLQFKCNQVWELTPRPSNANVVGTKWIFKNKIRDVTEGMKALCRAE